MEGNWQASGFRIELRFRNFEEGCRTRLHIPKVGFAVTFYTVFHYTCLLTQAYPRLPSEVKLWLLARCTVADRNLGTSPSRSETDYSSKLKLTNFALSIKFIFFPWDQLLSVYWNSYSFISPYTPNCTEGCWEKTVYGKYIPTFLEALKLTCILGWLRTLLVYLPQTETSPSWVPLQKGTSLKRACSHEPGLVANSGQIAFPSWPAISSFFI